MDSHQLKSTLLFLVITTTTISALKERCHPHDKKVLLSIARSFNSPFWPWSPNTDCCTEWHGVRCDSITNRVMVIDIFNAANFVTTIPPAIGDLPYLTEITFRKLPNVTGTIPSSIANLKYLTLAQFSWNSLSGPIPSFFHLIPSLFFLDLSFNRFSGSIPPELGLSPSLFVLDLSRNLLTGPIPDSFTHFRTSGKQPVLWTNIATLTLSHNQLSGPIPRSLGNVSFDMMDLSRNQLTGDASFLFRNVKFSLTLSRNNLSFDFSTVEIPNSSVLELLDLNHNQIYGSFPSKGMENVEFLNVSYNRLCGPIPNVGKLQTIDQTAYFHNKCLCGTPLAACKSLS